MFYKRELKKIMEIPDPDRTVPLRTFAKKIGVSLYHTYDTNGVHDEPELLRRVHEKISLNYSSKATIISIVSLIISVVALILNFLKQ